MSDTATLELLSRFLDGDVDEAERRRAEELLESDDEARRIYDGLTRVRGQLAALPETEAPPHLGALVRQRVASETLETTVWNRLERQIRRWLFDPSFLPAFAVLVALAAMIYVLAQGLARVEQAHEPLILSAPEGTEFPQDRTAIGAREFVREDDRWIEVGLTSADDPARVLAGEELEAWLADRPELEGLRELGQVVLTADDTVVRLDFGSDSRHP